MRYRSIFICCLILAVFVVGTSPILLAHNDNGGGLTVGWLSLENFEGFNQSLEENGYSPLSNGFFTFGGWGPLWFFDDIRMGIGGASGQLKTQNVDKIAKLEIGYGVFDVAYSVFRTDETALAIGAGLLGGSAELSLLSNRPVSFGDAVSTPTSTNLERFFAGVKPYANLGFNAGFLDIQITGSYLFTFADKWELRGNRFDGPPLDFNGWGVEVSVGFSFPDDFDYEYDFDEHEDNHEEDRDENTESEE